MANPGKLNYGASLATPPHLLSTLFKTRAGIEVVYIPYKGSAPSVTDLMAGTTQSAFSKSGNRFCVRTRSTLKVGTLSGRLTGAHLA